MAFDTGSADLGQDPNSVVGFDGPPGATGPQGPRGDRGPPGPLLDYLTQDNLDGRYIRSIGGKVSGELQSTSANCYRMVQGNYGAFWRNDGSGLYLLLTAAGDQYGLWNGVRPFQVDLVSGLAYINNSVPWTAANFDPATKLDAASYSAADVLAKIKTVDGPNSGLDADLFDGRDSGWYTDVVARLGYTPFSAAGGAVSGSIILDNGASDTPEIRFLDDPHGTAAYIDMSLEVWRVYGSYRGGGAVVPLQVNLADQSVTVSGQLYAGTGVHANGGSLSARDNCYVGNSAAFLQTNGDVYGPAWGGYLSNIISGIPYRAGAAGIGSLGLFRCSVNCNHGAYIAGSNLKWCSIQPSSGTNDNNQFAAGTWMALCDMGSSSDRIGLFMRVA
ncbi:MAG: collagen-like triple helix repeat-containing protein [Pararhizobium sp.]